MIIGIDFDGTCVTHEFPNIGKDIGAVPVLRKLVEQGHKLVLFTVRSDIQDPKSSDDNITPIGGNYLTEAVNWFKDNGIELWGININPDQHTWSHSPKAYCHLYIDDAALGCPLTINKTHSDRPFADWGEIEKILNSMGTVRIKGTITFYKASGQIIETIPTEGWTNHKDRCRLADEHRIYGWNHYSMHDTNIGMKRFDNNTLYEIDLETGKIIKKIE